MTHRFVSTAIPYVNAAPHIGFALELVLADVVARHARQRGERVYFLSGTDENSVKNALAAEAAGLQTQAFVDRRADEFAALKDLLNLSYDDFLRTSSDLRHAPAVAKLWEACEQQGDIYSGAYEGLYCVGCEQFYSRDDLVEGVCPEHRTAPEAVAERNYFFRLSRYQGRLRRLIERNELAIRPANRRQEILALLEAPLADLSISRSVERARGWGLPVPGDDSQIIYVWFDALANYVSAPGYATDPARFEKRWGASSRITHVIGKGVTRFHAIYWPAILLSAGLPLPSELFVHGYVTVEGRKIGKSLGNAIAPADLCARFGPDALRYYLLRHIGSRRDGDFSWERFAEIYATELANELGNLVSRTTALERKFGRAITRSTTLAAGLPDAVAQDIDIFAIDGALEAIWKVVRAANAYVNQTEPWRLAKEGRTAELEAVLTELHGTVHAIGEALGPFLPAAARRVLDDLATGRSTPLFPKLSS